MYSMDAFSNAFLLHIVFHDVWVPNCQLSSIVAAVFAKSKRGTRLFVELAQHIRIRWLKNSYILI